MTLRELNDHIQELERYQNLYIDLEKVKIANNTKNADNSDTKEFILTRCYHYIYDNKDLKKLVSKELTNNSYTNGRIDDGIFTQKYFLSHFPTIMKKLKKIEKGYIKLKDKIDETFDDKKDM